MQTEKEINSAKPKYEKPKFTIVKENTNLSRTTTISSSTKHINESETSVNKNSNYI